MKRLGVALGIFAVAIAIFVYVVPGRTSPVAPATQVVARAKDEDTGQLLARVAELQQDLVALKRDLAAQRSGHPPEQRPPASGDAKVPDIERVEAQRAADAQRRHEYMASIEQAFANEKVEPMWASRASARVGSTFEGDEMLRNIAHTVECRQKTCRVQLDDDGSGRLSGRMPFLTLGLADVLPQVSAEHIDQPNGRGAMVLYMSSQRLAPAASASTNGR